MEKAVTCGTSQTLSLPRIKKYIVCSWRCGSLALWLFADNRSQFVVASAVIYVACLGLAKTSILLIFRRISSEKRMHLAIYIVGVAVFIYSVVTACLLIFPCRPFARAWDATITTGSCINRPAVYVATAVSNIVTDVFILIIPIPMVIKLKIPLQQKLGLGCMFAVGSL